MIAFFLHVHLCRPDLLSVSASPVPVLCFFVGRCLIYPIAFRFFAGPVWYRMFNLLGDMPIWLMLPAVSGLGRPLEPIIGIGALLLSDFVGYHLELMSRRAFPQRDARAV